MGYKTLLEKKVAQETARVKLWRLGLESGTRKMQERKVPMVHNLNYDTFSLMKECDEFLKSYAEMQASMEDLAKEELKDLEEKLSISTRSSTSCLRKWQTSRTVLLRSYTPKPERIARSGRHSTDKTPPCRFAWWAGVTSRTTRSSASLGCSM